MSARDPRFHDLLNLLAEEFARPGRNKSKGHAAFEKRIRDLISERLGPKVAQELDRLRHVALAGAARNEEARQEIEIADLDGAVHPAWNGSAWEITIVDGRIDAGKVYPLEGERYLRMSPDGDTTEEISLAGAIEDLVQDALDR